jgi:hypothetical protein
VAQPCTDARDGGDIELANVSIALKSALLGYVLHLHSGLTCRHRPNAPGCLSLTSNERVIRAGYLDISIRSEDGFI